MNRFVKKLMLLLIVSTLLISCLGMAATATTESTDPPEVMEEKCACVENCDHTADTCYCATDCSCENCASFQNALEGDLDNVNNVDHFRGVQGAKDLSYLYGKVSDGIAGLQPLPQNTGVTWDTAGAIPYLGIRGDGFMHPGVNDATGELYHSALCWTAPKDLIIDVYFDAVLDLAANDGDGTAVSVYLNETCLKTLNLEVKDGAAATDALAVEFKTIKVNEGDKLYFVVDPQTNIACDGTLLYAEISWVKEVEPDQGNDKPGETEGNANNNQNDSNNNQNNSNETPKPAEPTPVIWIVLCCVVGVAVLAAIVMIVFKRKKHGN